MIWLFELYYSKHRGVESMPKQDRAISFEAPLYRQPSEHLRNFMRKLKDKPVQCHAVWRDDQKLTFYISKSEKATVVPFLRKGKKTKTVVNKMPAFASKFNVTNIATLKNEAEMDFELLSREDLEKRGESLDPIYGEDVVCVMRITVFFINEDARNVLLNFFGILDISIEPLSFYLQLQDWPSREIFDFIRRLERDKTPCYVEAKRHESIVFNTEVPDEANISIPITSKEDRKKVARKLSVFASKFNATTTFIAKGQASISIQIVLNKRTKQECQHPAFDDEETLCIMQVDVDCNEADARNALGDFFNMLDKYGN